MVTVIQYYMDLHATKPVFGVYRTEQDSNQSPQLQFRYDTLQKANNKGADQTDCPDVEKEIIKKT